MLKTVAFKKVNEPYGWLSNMSPHPIEKDGMFYPTAEHYFQCLRFEDKKIITDICSVKSPMSAKMKAKRFKEYLKITPRSEQDIENMSHTINLKISQHPFLTLLLSDMKDSFIIEDVTNRPNTSGLFWGMAFINGKWIGNNHLGNIWMNKIKENNFE